MRILKNKKNEGHKNDYYEIKLTRAMQLWAVWAKGASSDAEMLPFEQAVMLWTLPDHVLELNRTD